MCIRDSVTLAISDVPGDDPAVIASGPTVPDPTTFADARAVLARYRVAAPRPVIAHLEAAADETPEPGDRRLTGHAYHMVARPQDALDAAAAACRAEGLDPLILGDRFQGEAREVAREHAALALRAGRERTPGGRPLVLLSGGETTVTVRGGGRGGRNAEYLLALAIALQSETGVSALAADTDGIDGTEDNAGAVIRPDTLARACALGLDPAAHLDDNDAYSLFAMLGDLVMTGPTRTNVNDFRAILIER